MSKERGTELFLGQTESTQTPSGRTCTEQVTDIWRRTKTYYCLSSVNSSFWDFFWVCSIMESEGGFKNRDRFIVLGLKTLLKRETNSILQTLKIRAEWKQTKVVIQLHNSAIFYYIERNCPSPYFPHRRKGNSLLE